VSCQIDRVEVEYNPADARVSTGVKLTFDAPVDLPVSVKGWTPSGDESQALPEDDLGRMITTEVPAVACSNVSLVNVLVSFVGTPGVWVAAPL